MLKGRTLLIFLLATKVDNWSNFNGQTLAARYVIFQTFLNFQNCSLDQRNIVFVVLSRNNVFFYS